MPNSSIAGSSASTNHSETCAAATPHPTSTPTACPSVQPLPRSCSSSGGDRSGLAELRPRQHREDHEQRQRTDHRERLLVLAGRQVQRVGERRQHHRRDREHQQARDHPRRLPAETQHAVAPAARHEGEPEDQQRVRQDRADQRRLHHGHQPGLQREDADEELGQVAHRRLHDPGGRRPRADPPRWSVSSPIRYAIPASATAATAKVTTGAATAPRSTAVSATRPAAAAMTVRSRRSMLCPSFVRRAPTLSRTSPDCNAAAGLTCPRFCNL